jgi:hypothetical protein
MTIPEFDLATIERWAYTKDLDEIFGQYEEEDPDLFELKIGNACSLKEQFRFVADPKCLKRYYFAQLLVPNLCWIYRIEAGLPFQFSRLQGIMNRDAYLGSVADYGRAVYERAEIIEEMRLSNDPALQAFAKALLDHRHERMKERQQDYVKLLRSIHSTVVPLFANA